MAKYENLATNNTKQAATAAITEDLDSGVGKVLDAVERLGLSENTYIIYMSDNGSGGGGRRGGLSGGKGSVWEGGIRVPLIVQGPNVGENSWCHAPVVGYDFLPTLCALAGVPTSELPRDGARRRPITFVSQFVDPFRSLRSFFFLVPRNNPR